MTLPRSQLRFVRNRPISVLQSRKGYALPRKGLVFPSHIGSLAGKKGRIDDEESDTDGGNG